MTQQRRAGTISLAIDGEIYDAKGNFEYNLGKPKRNPILGADRPHGYAEEQQIASLSGEITDRSELDFAKLVGLDGVTVTLTLGNGKTIVFNQAWYAGEGTGNSEEGNLQFVFNAVSADEIT